MSIEESEHPRDRIQHCSLDLLGGLMLLDMARSPLSIILFPFCSSLFQVLAEARADRLQPLLTLGEVCPVLSVLGDQLLLASLMEFPERCRKDPQGAELDEGLLHRLTWWT